MANTKEKQFYRVWMVEKRYRFLDVLAEDEKEAEDMADKASGALFSEDDNPEWEHLRTEELDVKVQNAS